MIQGNSVSVLSLADYKEHPEYDRAFREDYTALLKKAGYIHVTDVPDGFDYPRFLARFGDFYPGPSGKPIDDIVVEPGMDDVYYGGNRRALLPHTEAYELDGLPPRYLALWCIVPSVEGSGETTILDAYPLIEQLCATERSYLETHLFGWQASEGLRRRGLGSFALHPILEVVDGITVLRFSYNNVILSGAAEPVTSFLNRTKQVFDAEHLTIAYQRNDLLHFDNWRMLHSRNEFRDVTRHLKRAQIKYRADDARENR